MEGLILLARFVILVGLTCGPLVALLGALNCRDRRQSAVLATVLEHFASPDYRGQIAVQVRCALFSRRSTVRVYMLAWSCDEIWDAITRLSQVLPPHIRVVVEGTLDPRSPLPFTVETRGRHRLSSLTRPSVVPG